MSNTAKSDALAIAIREWKSPARSLVYVQNNQVARNCTVHIIQERSQHTVMGRRCSEYAKCTITPPIIETNQGVTSQFYDLTVRVFPNCFGVVFTRAPIIACI